MVGNGIAERTEDDTVLEGHGHASTELIINRLYMMIRDGRAYIEVPRLGGRLLVDVLATDTIRLT